MRTLGWPCLEIKLSRERVAGITFPWSLKDETSDLVLKTPSGPSCSWVPGATLEADPCLLFHKVNDEKLPIMQLHLLCTFSTSQDFGNNNKKELGSV